MPASKANSSSNTATAASRTAGFILGANWHRSDSTGPAGRHQPGQPADVLQGIITHYVEPDLRPKLKEPADGLRLSEDLGLDSLDMMEIMLRVEERLKVQVSDHELRHFRTLGELRRFIDRHALAIAAALPTG